MKLINKDVHEHYCSLEMLQLLYDKGMRFREWTEGAFHRNSLAEKRFNEGDVSHLKDTVTHQIVVEWLRVNHGIWVTSLPNFNYKYWTCFLSSDKNGLVNLMENYKYKSPQESIEEGILYVLNKLIP